MTHTVLPENREVVISVGGSEANINGFDSDAIQMAVELLKAHGGGTVKLEKGIYEIYAPIRLAANIMLAGAGEETILHKVDGFQSLFAEDADYGELFIQVKDASGFREGMGIMVYDSHYDSAWDVSTAVISKVEKNKITFDNYLIRDYDADLSGTVSNACSVIEGVEVENVKITGLSIDGNGKNNDTLNGCRGGGIYFHKSRNCVVEHVKLWDFNGDGIRWQIDENVTISACDVSGCTGYGIHPGSGSLNTLVEKCDIHDNGSDGMFVCWRVQKSIFRNNSFRNNGGSGICIGHKDTDNLFEQNRICENAFCGVYMRKEKAGNGAHRNRYIKNTIENNGSGENGYGFVIDSYTEQISIEDNVISDTGGNRQRIALLIRAETPDLKLARNVISDHCGGDIIYRIAERP